MARFDGPSGLAASVDGTLYVADTNNHLVNDCHGNEFRYLGWNGTIRAIMGGVVWSDVFIMMNLGW